MEVLIAMLILIRFHKLILPPCFYVPKKLLYFFKKGIDIYYKTAYNKDNNKQQQKTRRTKR